MKVSAQCHTRCACPGCLALTVYPDMPSMSPPPANAIGKDRELWTLDCNYLGPLIDGKATLLRRLFKTDGGSIPKPAWPLIGHPFQMPYLAYFLPHDGDYAAELYPRDECDSRMLTGSAEDGRIGWVKRNGVWVAVRSGGWAVWAKHTPESVADARKYCYVVDETLYCALVESKSLSSLDGCPGDVLQHK